MARRQLVGIVSALFAATGSWPKAEDVRRRLSASYVSADAVANLPARLGTIDADDRVVLTLRALRSVASASDVVADFMAAVRFAAGRYRDWDSDPVLSSEELAVELSLSPLRARRAMALLESEGLVRTLAEGEEAEVAAEIDRYAAVRGSRAYVRRRPGVRKHPRSAPASIGSWLRNREHNTRDLIAIAAIGGVFAVVATAEIPGALDRAPPPKASPQQSPKAHHLRHFAPKDHPQRPEQNPNPRSPP